MIHRRKEGEAFRWGLNFDLSRVTLFGVYLLVPIWRKPHHLFEDFSGNLFSGESLVGLLVGFRIRRIIPEEVRSWSLFKRIGYRVYFWWEIRNYPIRKLLATRV
jgi:hypothetical protein